MERCEGYFRLENRRCDRTATRDVRAADGHYYQVCEHHARQAWTASVAHWNGDSDIARPLIRLQPRRGSRLISLPLAHASGKGGREVLRGVELALEGAAPSPYP
jgi:hypothetical protein